MTLVESLALTDFSERGLESEEYPLTLPDLSETEDSLFLRLNDGDPEELDFSH